MRLLDPTAECVRHDPDPLPTRFTAPFIDTDGSSAIASTTNRTERSRNSSGYFLGAGMNPPLRGISPFKKPGAIQSATQTRVGSSRGHQWAETMGW
jgi:hypothetical protein